MFENLLIAYIIGWLCHITYICWCIYDDPEEREFFFGKSEDAPTKFIKEYPGFGIFLFVIVVMIFCIPWPMFMITRALKLFYGA